MYREINSLSIFFCFISIFCFYLICNDLKKKDKGKRSWNKAGLKAAVGVYQRSYSILGNMKIDVKFHNAIFFSDFFFQKNSALSEEIVITHWIRSYKKMRKSFLVETKKKKKYEVFSCKITVLTSWVEMKPVA